MNRPYLGAYSRTHALRPLHSAASLFVCFFAALLLLGDCTAAWAELSARGAFVLIKKIPPGEDLSAVSKFMGAYTSEKVIDAKGGIKLRRWGTSDDKWFIEVLHNGSLVRASRITWSAASRGEQQTIFAQLTTAGKNFFGRTGKFHGSEEAEWGSFDEKWLVRVKMGSSIEDGVTMLSGIRDNRMESAKYGF